MWLCLSVCMYTNAAVSSGMLYVHFRHDIRNMTCKGKGRGKGHPRTGHEGPKGSRGIALLFL